ncbi:hypothetical protein ABPG72_011941 [Tetrahymena utriculariae]
MSWNYCAITGEQLHEPVVSKKSGHVFEKRVIEKHIQSTGQCPITGQALSNDDLIPVQLNVQTKPRSVTANSIPGILKTFQNEWDALMLETYNLKQHLETVRQELSHALYQHDAACRVIARLIKERDEARFEVAQLQEKLRQGKMELEETEAQNEQQQEQANNKLPQNIIDSINETALKLNQIRKDRKKDAEYNSKFAATDVISSYGPKETVGLHSTTNPGINALDYNRQRNLVISGGKDGSIILYNTVQNVILGTVELNKHIVALSFLGNDENPHFVAVTEHAAHLYQFQAENKQFKSLYTYNTNSSFTSVSAHPNGTLFVLSAKDGSVTYHDAISASLVLEVNDLVGKVSVNSIQVHPDGNLLGIGCSDGSIKLWSISANEIMTSLEDNVNGAIDLINFSENGYILSVGSTVSKVVKIYDLRRAKCIKTLFGEGDEFSLSSIEFDLSGNVFAAGSTTGQIKLYETKKWNHLSTFSYHTAAVKSLKFGNFSKELVSGSLDRNLIISSQ